MKKLLVSFILGVILASALKSQPIRNDTAVFVIDTTKNYVKVKKSATVEGIPEGHWQVSVDGHYYENFAKGSDGHQ